MFIKEREKLTKEFIFHKNLRTIFNLEKNKKHTINDGNALTLYLFLKKSFYTN